MSERSALPPARRNSDALDRDPIASPAAGNERDATPSPVRRTPAACLRAVQGALARLRTGVAELEAASDAARVVSPLVALDVWSSLTRARAELDRLDRGVTAMPWSAAVADARSELAALAPRAEAALAAQARLTPQATDAAMHADAAAMASRLGLGAVDVRRDAAARTVADLHGARGVALGTTVHLHPERMEIATDRGREVLAHELVHLAQAKLGAEHDAGREAAEEEARNLAPALARGASVGAPRRRIDLGHAAADHGHAGAAPATAATTDDVDSTALMVVEAEAAWMAIQNQRLANDLTDQPSSSLVPALHAAGKRLRDAKLLLSSRPSGVDLRWKEIRDLYARIDVAAAGIEQAEADLTSTAAKAGSSSTAAILGDAQPTAAPAFTRGARSDGALTGMQGEAYIRNAPLVYNAIAAGSSATMLGTGRVVLHDDLASYTDGYRDMLIGYGESPEVAAKHAKEAAVQCNGVTDPVRKIAHVYAPSHDPLATIHELMHVYTDSWVLTGTTHNFVEGVADYYTREVCRANKLAFVASYPGELVAIAALADQVGDALLASFVFGGSRALIQRVDLLGKGTWDEYISWMRQGEYGAAAMTLIGLRAAGATEDAKQARQNDAYAAEAHPANPSGAVRLPSQEPPESEWAPEGETVEGVGILNSVNDGATSTLTLNRGGKHGVRDGWIAVLTPIQGEVIEAPVSGTRWRQCTVVVPAIPDPRNIHDVQLRRGAR